jgi:hypothetical protein
VPAMRSRTAEKQRLEWPSGNNRTSVARSVVCVRRLAKKLCTKAFTTDDEGMVDWSPRRRLQRSC